MPASGNWRAIADSVRVRTISPSSNGDRKSVFSQHYKSLKIHKLSYARRSNVKIDFFHIQMLLITKFLKFREYLLILTILFIVYIFVENFYRFFSLNSISAI